MTSMTDGKRDPAGDSIRRTAVVIVTNSGAGDRLQACVESVRCAGGADHVIVVDNSGRPADVGDAGGPPVDGRAPVSVIRSDNRGYGAAFNLAARDQAVEVADYVALLNDDVVVGDGWLEAPCTVLDSEPTVGVVQPKLVLAGTEPPLINSLGVELDEHGAGVDIGLRTLESDAPTETHTIEIFSGGALVFRRTFLLDVGGFDERFFLYYEDVDLALRGAERGWGYRCTPNSRVVHSMGATTDGIATERRRLQERNRLTVAVRFGSFADIRSALWLSIRRLRHHPRSVHASALGAGLARMPRALIERRRARSDRA